jgi:F-type H+/Na+-transporting ATPase subunit alpha
VANLKQEIEEQITGAKRAVAWENVGVIREVGDGVAKIEGLTDAMLNEMIDLGHGITGLALNLEETEVGVIILGDYTQLEEGDEARTTGRLMQVPVGKGLLGRVVNTLANPSTAKGQSRVTSPIRSRRWLLVSFGGTQSTSRCKRESCRLMR